ncbi:hypothetical protein GYMLUDRAFT_239539 [Collybiopsis luxurians FD-317 M1]|nr:hypothetical protein GYMLUDRAFT_239539 [Collybiopsis luxurians FD-317 M1]
MNILQHVDMRMDVPPADLDNKVFLTGYTGMTFAAAVTILRLALRVEFFGWDDAFAGMGLICLIIVAVAGKLLFELDASSTMPQSSRVALYYIMAVNFNTIIWLSRLSILFTIMRVGGYRHYRKGLYAAAGCFVFAMLILIAQVFWVCELQNRRNHWKANPSPQCIEDKSMAIAQVATDVFADIILVSAPLFLLRSLQWQHARGQKLRLIGSFVVGGLTTCVSVVHAVYALDGDKISLFVGNIEVR